MREPQIVISLRRDKREREIVAEYPFGTWGLKSAMGLAYDLSEEIRDAGNDPSTAIRIAIGDFDWPAQEAVDDMIMYDAGHYQTRIAILEDLFERFAPEFVESPEDKIAHLTDAERETYAEITVGSEKQIEFARGRYLEDHIRNRRMNQLLSAMDELERSGVNAAVNELAAYLLVMVPKCSVFWIEDADSDDIRQIILSRLSGQPQPNQSRNAVRLGEQMDRAE